MFRKTKKLQIRNYFVLFSIHLCRIAVLYFCDYPVMKMEGDQYTKITQELPDRVNMKKADLKV